MKRGILFVALVLFWVQGLQAQQKEIVYTVSVQPQYAWVYAHSESIQYLKGSTGYGIQIDLNRYRKDPLAYSYAKRHYNTGFGFQYINFSDSTLGQAVNFSYFMEPFLIERGSFSWRLRCAGGLNLASNPHDATTNPLNKSYSSHINGYLGLGMSLRYQPTNGLGAYVDATYSHFSNGNLANPNAGLNYPHIGAGIEYKIGRKNKDVGSTLFYEKMWRFDAVVFGCNKSLPYTPDVRYWAYGAMVQAGYASGKINAWTLALEAYKDESMRYAMDHHPDYYDKNYDNRLVGLLGGHEFLFNRCLFSQQLGVYLYKEVPGEFINRVYHRWGYSYKLSRKVMMGINLNANLQKAFLFDLRLAYCWYK